VFQCYFASLYSVVEPHLTISSKIIKYVDAGENELGVVIAKSEAGQSMVPVSWTEMQCPKTYVKEYRKVAKVIPDHLANDPANL
jgi:exosome complex RNA-binding protein Csl4